MHWSLDTLSSSLTPCRGEKEICSPGEIWFYTLYIFGANWQYSVIYVTTQMVCIHAMLMSLFGNGAIDRSVSFTCHRCCLALDRLLKVLPRETDPSVISGFEIMISSQKLHMCLWNTDAHGGNKVKLWERSLRKRRNMVAFILTPPHPQGHVMSVKCEQPLDEQTVRIWLLYDHPTFKSCTLFISGTELRTDKRTDGRTDRQTDGRSNH